MAPQCNISCNYCNRKFDCLNESRPGVTSEVLTPEEALEKFQLVRKALDNLSVVGIAGPGDALAEWHNTGRTIELIRQYDKEIIFCLSTNGLKLPKFAREIIALGVKHVTVTVNSLDPAIGEKIYGFVNYEGKKYRGKEGAALLIENQLGGIEMLARQGILVKVNIVLMEGINDAHVPEIVKKVKELGAVMTNIVPLIPVQGSAFANLAPTSAKLLNETRKACQVHLQQMMHCRQCRADAIGLLNEDGRNFVSAQKFSSKTSRNCI